MERWREVRREGGREGEKNEEVDELCFYLQVNLLAVTQTFSTTPHPPTSTTTTSTDMERGIGDRQREKERERGSGKKIGSNGGETGREWRRRAQQP